MDHNSVLFKKALATLDAAGAQYRIIMPDGTSMGTLQVVAAEPPKKRRKLTHPYGTLKKHYLPFCGDIQPGQCIDVPCGPFMPLQLVSAISAHFCHVLGNGKVTVAQNKERGVIEVLRVE